jgi:Fic family protein
MLSPRLAARLSEKQQRLDALRPLPPALLSRVHDLLAVEWVYNSNAIEGNTLTLRETRLILETGLTVGGKRLREHLEVVNHERAIHFVEELAAAESAITPFHIRSIHRLVLAGIDDEWAGQYRSVSARIAGAGFEPPDAWELPRIMDDLGAWLGGEALGLSPVERATLAHHRLAAIHPFVDGNGRTARLLMNLLLMRSGYPPAVIQRSNRRQYYATLARADRGDPHGLVELVGRAVDRSLTLYLEAATPALRPPAADEAWLPLGVIAADSAYSQEYLSLLARTGRIEAIKRGRVWYSTRGAVAAYRASVVEH